MVGIAMFALVGAALTSLLAGTLNAFSYQTRMVDAQTDLANAMALFQDDIRHLGYVTDNMNQNIFQQITSGTGADGIQFVGDVNSDNVSDRVTYALASGTLMRTQEVWNGTNGWMTSVAQPVVANVTTFTLEFYSVDPCTATINQQTAQQILNSGTMTYLSVKLIGASTYKGQTVSRTLSSDIAERQENVRPVCS